MQEWEAVIVRINKDTFDADLLDITRKQTIADESATLNLNCFSEEDIKKFKLDPFLDG